MEAWVVIIIIAGICNGIYRLSKGEKPGRSSSRMMQMQQQQMHMDETQRINEETMRDAQRAADQAMRDANHAANMNNHHHNF